MNSFASINPATGKTLAIYEEPNDVGAIVTACHAAFLSWRQTTFSERAAALLSVAKLLRQKSLELARLMTLEMGKPIAQAAAEIEKCAWCCEHYAAHAQAMLADQLVATDAKRSFITFNPLGVVLAVMPWNFPFWQVFRFLAPAVMAGNAVLLKHAANVTGCAQAIASLLSAAGLPQDLLRVLVLPPQKLDAVIASPDVAAVTLTGSTTAGRSVAASAGRHLKKCVLELGGSDPFIVLEDADLEAAARIGAASRCLNAGQSCIAAKRFIVVDKVYDAFENLFAAEMAKMTCGDPLEHATKMGPLARLDLRDALHAQVTESVTRGARVILGGAIPVGAGAFYPATVLTQVSPGMPAYDEELFGPVATLLRARDAADAVRLANDTEYGLGASVFARDLERAEEIARMGLNAGSVFINGMVKSDPRLPFGGIKNSGYGRELGVFGIHEFVNIKSVWMA